MNELDLEFYNLQLNTNIAYEFHRIYDNKYANKAEFVLKFVKTKIKKKTISKQLINYIKQKLHLKKQPQLFLNEWDDRIVQYATVLENLKRNKGKSEYTILSEIFSDLEKNKQAPLSKFFQCGDLMIDDSELEKQFAYHGYLEVNFSEKDKFDNQGNLTDFLEITFVGSQLNQMNKAIDILNLSGLELLYPTSFNKFPNVNKMYIKNLNSIEMLKAA